MDVNTVEDSAGPRPEESSPIYASKSHLWSAMAGVAVLIVAIAAFFLIPQSWQHLKRISDDGLYRQAFLRLYVVYIGVFCAVFLVKPLLHSAVARLRFKWHRSFTYLALLGICSFLWLFVVHFGRWQFGAFDFNILIDLGWRQVLGQRPYVDFPATTPPGFNLGCKFAFELFGVKWDGNLYWAALYTCTTFLWMYFLMRRMAAGRLSAVTIAFAVECAAMLTLCFWWYNNSALIAAAVFFLSCIVFAQRPNLLSIQASYLLSLVLLSLMKPNIAGLTIVCCVPLLLLATSRKLRLLGLTGGAVLLALVVLRLNHVPVTGMLHSYLSVAKDRGSIQSPFGFNEMNKFEQHSAECWVALLSIPLVGAFLEAYRRIKLRDLRGTALALIIPTSCLITCYGLLTNGEFRDVECTLLLAAIGALSFGLKWHGPWMRRFTVAILCASIAGDLYYGAKRIRVYGIGPHVFFEWQDNQHRIDAGFFKNMRIGGGMVQVQKDVAEALHANPGPYFFGTRVDYNYAVFGLPSPVQFPAWWHPGTAFPFSEESKILEQWKQDRFQTLVFMKSGFAGYDEGMFYTYYPQELMDTIKKDYVPDQRYSTLTVYHRR